MLPDSSGLFCGVISPVALLWAMCWRFSHCLSPHLSTFGSIVFTRKPGTVSVSASFERFVLRVRRQKKKRWKEWPSREEALWPLALFDLWTFSYLCMMRDCAMYATQGFYHNSEFHGSGPIVRRLRWGIGQLCTAEKNVTFRRFPWRDVGFYFPQIDHYEQESSVCATNWLAGW